MHTGEGRELGERGGTSVYSLILKAFVRCRVRTELLLRRKSPTFGDQSRARDGHPSKW